jgi:hypothetical protein
MRRMTLDSTGKKVKKGGGADEFKNDEDQEQRGQAAG